MHVYVGEGMIRLINLDCNRNALKGFIQQMVKVGLYRSASWNVCFFYIAIATRISEYERTIAIKNEF